MGMAATGQSTTTPSRFNFLKEGLLLPTHNRRLFAAVFSIIVASTCLLLLVDHVAVEPLIRDEQIGLDTKVRNSTDPSSPDFVYLINSTDPSSPDFVHLIQKIHDDTRALLLTGTAYLLFTVIVVSAIRLVVLFAAVATYSGELHTIGTLLGKVRTQLKGPVLTLAFVYALAISCFALLVAMFALLVFLAIKDHFGLFFVVWLLLLVPFVVFLVYFSFLCSLSVVVAVAEPGRHGAAALARAWRLMKGKRRQAVLLIFVTSFLAAAFFRIHTLAKRCELSDNMVAGLLLGFLYVVLMSAVQLFQVCAMAAFYYECKGSSTEASAAEYLMVSTKQQFDAC